MNTLAELEAAELLAWKALRAIEETKLEPLRLEVARLEREDLSVARAQWATSQAAVDKEKMRQQILAALEIEGTI